MTDQPEKPIYTEASYEQGQSPDMVANVINTLKVGETDKPITCIENTASRSTIRNHVDDSLSQHSSNEYALIEKGGGPKSFT